MFAKPRQRRRVACPSASSVASAPSVSPASSVASAPKKLVIKRAAKRVAKKAAKKEVNKERVKGETEIQQKAINAVKTGFSESEESGEQEKPQPAKKVRVQKEVEEEAEVRQMGRPGTEEGMRRKNSSSSKYLCMRTEWVITYPGEKPPADKLTQTMVSMRQRGNCQLANNMIRFKFNAGILEFKKPIACGNALNIARRILERSVPEDTFDWGAVDIDFVDGQRPIDNYEEKCKEDQEFLRANCQQKEEGCTSDEQDTADVQQVPASPGKTSTALGKASVCVSVPSASLVASVPSVASASVDVASASLHVRAAVDKASLLRFKAAHLLRWPMASPPWMPRKGLEHASGSHGSVTFAFDKDREQDVAIKVLTVDRKIGFFDELEALLLAGEHPCVVKLLDVVNLRDKTVGVLLERLGSTLESVLVQTKFKSPGKERGVAWPLPRGRFEEGFRGLWSALAFLAQRRLAHSDIKPSNICFWKVGDEFVREFDEKGRGKLILCDFGAATIRMDISATAWPSDAIEKKNGVEVSSLPYRAPELFFGMADYSVAIDVWSLGVVQVESAMNAHLFRGVGEGPAAFRQFFRKHGDTRGDLNALKALPFGTEQDWEKHDGLLIGGSNRAQEYLGGNAEPLLRGTLRLNPEKRLSAQAVWQLPFFQGTMVLHGWDTNVASAPDSDFVVSAPKKGKHFTRITGERGPCQLQIGHLSPELVEDMLRDEYWKKDHKRDWAAPKGSTKAKERKRMMVEIAEAGTSERRTEKWNVKMQITGRTNNCTDTCDDRDTWNHMSLEEFSPAASVVAFMKAFKCANEPVWVWIDKFFLEGPLKDFKDPKQIGCSGSELLRLSSREWFGNCASIQLTRLHRHAETRHIDPGAAIMLLVVTLAGSRTLTVFPDDRDEKQAFNNVPGMVYLTSLCGVQHQVSYDGDSRGLVTPDLGEIGISIAYRTTLFRRSPYMSVRPGPELVWTEFNKMLQELHSKFVWKLPTRQQYAAALSDYMREAPN